MINVGIVIVSYNCFQALLICLKSLKKINKKGLSIKTIVVDNASSDFQPQLLKTKYPQVNFIENKRNLGFGHANNQAVKKLKRENIEYFLLLNPDTKVDIDPEFLLKLVAIMAKNKNIGVCAPVIKHHMAGKTFYDLGGALNINMSRARHTNLAQIPKAKHSYQKVDFVSGACMLVRAKALKRAGYFDEHYFLYLEDVDLCHKISSIEYKIVKVYTSMVYHYGGRSSSNSKKIFYSLISSLYFTLKWTPLLYKPVSIIYNLVFYPYLWLSWSLKRFKKSLGKLR